MFDALDPRRPGPDDLTLPRYATPIDIMLSHAAAKEAGLPVGRGEWLGIDGNGVPSELIWVDGLALIVHYDELPDCDRTVLDGIPVTTPLRTVIDLAPDLEPAQLRVAVQDCLRRELFTLEEARQRLAEPDMATRRGAVLLRRELGLSKR